MVFPLARITPVATALGLAGGIWLAAPVFAGAQEDFLSQPVCEQGNAPLEGAYLARGEESEDPCVSLDESWRALLPLKKSSFALCAPNTTTLAGYMRCEFEIQKVLLDRAQEDLGPDWTEAEVTAWLDERMPALVACQPGRYADRTEDLLKQGGRLTYNPLMQPSWGIFFKLCLEAIDSYATRDGAG